MIATYLVSFAAYYLLWKAYKHVVDLREEALMSSEVTPEEIDVFRDTRPVLQGQSRAGRLLFHPILPRHFLPIHNGHRHQQATKKPNGERPTNRTVFHGILDELTVMDLEKKTGC
ncbi:unnamed protein product [Cuscuta campestris]|uniref:Uncharacterized protein n=1 Tax=Cuscuta campestris TaxID=132261 RepID=A0A484K3H6_9ASTE|nr:unnamed protein product [Cuscuta campestris]